MKRSLFLLFLHISLFAFNQNINASIANSEKININRECKFKLGDYSGADAESYNDKDWSNIHLPHNFSIPYFQSSYWYTVNHWNKAERPSVYIENGHVAAMTVAVIDVEKEQDKSNDGHGSKVIMIPFDGATFDYDSQAVTNP